MKMNKYIVERISDKKIKASDVTRIHSLNEQAFVTTKQGDIYKISEDRKVEKLKLSESLNAYVNGPKTSVGVADCQGIYGIEDYFDSNGYSYASIDRLEKLEEDPNGYFSDGEGYWVWGSTDSTIGGEEHYCYEIRLHKDGDSVGKTVGAFENGMSFGYPTKPEELYKFLNQVYTKFRK